MNGFYHCGFFYFWIGYFVVCCEGFIALYACHVAPYGVRCTWRGLWQQLCYRKPERLPLAVLRRS